MIKTAKIKYSSYIGHGSSLVWCIDNKAELPEVLKLNADKEFYSKKSLIEIRKKMEDMGLLIEENENLGYWF